MYSSGVFHQPEAFIYRILAPERLNIIKLCALSVLFVDVISGMEMILLVHNKYKALRVKFYER